MDTPQPPKDTSLRNIIDKLAEFVARNGPEFETMTKAKQKGNPKFEFLYGGEFYQYYQYKIASEQAFVKQQNVQMSTSNQMSQQQSQMNAAGQMQNFAQSNSIWSTNQIQNPPSAKSNPQIDALNVQQQTLRDQIRQSEQNLSAQHGVLLQQQQSQIEDALNRAQTELIHKLAEESSLQINEYDGILQPIIESCTKESIANGKSWILHHASDSKKCHVLSQYLLKKALTNGAAFTQKLHLIYLVNDVIHHCVRKNCEDLKVSLESVVIPMFCSAQLSANDDQAAKLSKLLSLWESKANFFDACVISKLRSPPSSMQEYHTSLLTQHAAVITPLTQTTKATFENYQQQHQAFCQHASQQITLLEQQRQQIEQQALVKQALSNAAATAAIPPLLPELSQKSNVQQQSLLNNSSNNLSSNSNTNSTQQQISRIDATTSERMMGINPPPPLMSQNIPSLLSANLLSPQQHQQQQQQQHQSYSNNSNSSNNNNNSSSNGNNNSSYSGNFESQTNNNSSSNNNNNSNSNNIPSDFSLPPPNFPVPDLSRPPPGFSTPGSDGQGSYSQPEQQEIPAPVVEDLTPSLPYFELPAGLMVPLIRLEDYNYHALDPELIRLPPPTPPSERLISAVEAFYSLPCHDRPRDGEGWEKLGLYEYFKIKNSAKKQKEEEIANETRDRSRSPTPVDIDLIRPPKKLKKRIYRSRSRSRSPAAAAAAAAAATAADSTNKKRAKRSRSPPPVKRTASPPLPSRSPAVHRNRDRGNDRSERGNDRNNEPRPDNRNTMRDRRSLSPQAASFLGANYAKPNEFIEQTNKGHQMLMKMGWASGTGLGTMGQGIEEPISGGEVRDRQDKYKGVGISLVDPYENFRKNKGAAFITRMKSRSDV